MFLGGAPAPYKMCAGAQKNSFPSPQGRRWTAPLVFTRGRGPDEGFFRREVCVLAIRLLRIPHGIVLEYLEEFGRKVVETITVTGDQRGK